MKKSRIILLGFLILILMPIAYSFGVTTPYWDTNPLVMAPGQAVNFSLLLQNMVGNENVRAKASIVGGNQFIQILDKNNEYVVPLGTTNVRINLEVIIPENTIAGDYTLSVQVDTMPQGPAKMVQFATGVVQKIPLHVKGGAPIPTPLILASPVKENKQQSKGISTALISLILLAIVVIVVLLLWSKKRRDSENYNDE